MEPEPRDEAGLFRTVWVWGTGEVQPAATGGTTVVNRPAPARTSKNPKPSDFGFLQWR